MTPSGGEFAWASTLWSTVLQAADRSSEEGRAALERLARLYWKPVYFFVRRRTPDTESAQDLTQAFFAYLLDHDLLKRARPEQGSFRAYLRGILARFLSDQRDRDRAARRGGAAARIPLDFAEAETDLAYAPSAAESPEQAFERAWVEDTLARALERLRAEGRQEGHAHWWEALRLRFGLDVPALSYAEIARRLARSEADVTNVLHRARERLRDILLEEIRQGVSDERTLADELSAFRSIL